MDVDGRNNERIEVSKSKIFEVIIYWLIYLGAESKYLGNVVWEANYICASCIGEITRSHLKEKDEKKETLVCLSDDQGEAESGMIEK